MAKQERSIRKEMAKRTLSNQKHIKNLAKPFLDNVDKKLRENPRAILHGWDEIVGKKIAALTDPEKFENGILFVKVKQQMLYNLLVKHEYSRLLESLRKNFPQTVIEAIKFRIG